ncbi:MAG: riboflavin biosynthesis protein RibF [Bacteroidaceae bacterium]|nr:riboflavin biosynthesis protein RibF [Bacteroidaceae bacterium]
MATFAAKMEKSIRYVATIGFFDGVHQGHKCLIRQVRAEAEQRGMKSLVVTFPKHPRQVLATDYQPRLLTTCEEKLRLLRATGVDEIALMPFTRELSMLTAEEFMRTLHVEYGVDVLVIGYDHRFGHNRSEGFDDYVEYGKRMGLDVVLADEYDDGGLHCSSTEVRNALGRGDVDVANDILGYRYFVAGEVVNGFHVGTKIGYPTANLRVADEKLVPRNGVYVVKVGDHVGMLNIGCRPTLDNGSNVSIEVHIIDYDSNLYGSVLTLEFVKYIREERRFDSVDDLKRQLAQDESTARGFVGLL